MDNVIMMAGIIIILYNTFVKLGDIHTFNSRNVFSCFEEKQRVLQIH